MNRYRYVDGFYPHQPYLEEWTVVKETRCTIVVELYGERHRILKSAHKQFACATVGAALTSYRARKRRQVAILTERLAKAKACLAAADTEIRKPTPLLTFQE